jgi:hypothetical protein
MINALAFLSLNEVSSVIANLYTIIPIKLLPVAKYFDTSMSVVLVVPQCFFL